MRFLSLFSGIEAASVAFEAFGGKPVAFSEIEPFPSAVLAHHYPDVPNLGDVTKITEEQIAALGPIDLVCFGSPCQDLSVAGKRKGLIDATTGDVTRSGLFFAAMRIFKWANKHCGARFALWENVAGAYSSNKGEDFAAVVAEMAGLEDVGVPKNGWGSEGCAVGDNGMLEWACMDAQWFGVAQRRRRVFAVLDTGAWEDREPILLEPNSVRRDTPPSREAGEGFTHATAPCLTSSGRGVERTGDTRGQDPVVAVVAKWPADLTPTLNAHFGEKQGLEDQHINGGAGLFVPAVCVTGDITHTLKAEGFDASEDGTGRGQPIVVHGTQDPCVSEHTAFALGRNNGGENAIAFSCKDYGGDAGEISPTLRSMGHDGSHANAGGQVAVAVSPIAGAMCRDTYSGGLGGRVDMAVQGYVQPIAMQVRRLTPRECERLQGFPDDYTNITWTEYQRIQRQAAKAGTSYEAELRKRGKELRGQPVGECPDGPRYKALGNSMAVPNMRWIGRRIDAALRALSGSKSTPVVIKEGV